MRDVEKNKEQLINELAKLRQQVTELKKFEIKQQEVEKNLRETEEKYRTLLENIPAAYYRTDREGNMRLINPPGAELLGYNSPEEIIGKNLAKDLYYLPEDRKIFIEELNKRKGKVENYEATLKRKDGTPVIVSTSSHYYYDKEGNIAGVEGIFVDITERKEAEKLQQVLYHISRAANSPISLDQLYSTIHQELSSIIDTTNFYIALREEKEGQIYFPYNVDSSKPFHLPRSINHPSLIAEVVRTGKPLLVTREIIQKEKTLEKFKAWFGNSCRQVWLGVPLKIEDKTLGAIVLQSYTNPDLYSEKDIQLLEFVSSQVAIALERKIREEELKKLAYYDVLTGAYNRGVSLELLQRQMNLSKRNKSLLLLAYIDLDNLKDINDKFGHKEGDQVLIQVVKLFKSTLREVDIICRLGGDEFLLIFPETSPAEAPLIQERLSNNLEKLNQELVKPYSIDFSIGFSYYNPAHPLSLDKLIHLADQSMYMHKEKKRKN